MQLRRLCYILISAAVTVAVFAYLFSQVSLEDVLDLIKQADTNLLVMFVLASLGTSVLRMWRYLVVLRCSGFAPSPAALFLVVLVRNLFVDLLPAQIGSLIYVYLVRSRLGIPLGAAFSSFTLAVVFDLIALAPMVFLGAVWLAVERDLVAPQIFAGVLVLAVGTLLFLRSLPVFTAWLAHRLRHWSRAEPSRLRSCATLLEEFTGELERARSAGLYWPLFIFSLLVRPGKYTSLYFFLVALIEPLGYGFSKVPAVAAFMGTVAAEFAAALPLSGIAGFGLYEGTWAVVFRLLGFPVDIAQLTSIGHHLFTQAYGYGLGLAALGLLLLPLPLWRGRVLVAQGERCNGMRLGVKLSVYLAAWAACVSLTYSLDWRAAGQTKESKASIEKGGSAAAAQKIELPGTVVFDSNQSGGFGIFSLGPDGQTKSLFDTDHQEMYPDPAPAGDLIVFCRTISTVHFAPAEIWLMRRDGSAARKLADNGCFPTFSGDGSRIYFERGRKQVMSVDPVTARVERVFPRRSRAFKGYEIVKPRVSPDGKQVAFISDRGGRWNSWLVDLASEQERHLSVGCEPGWWGNDRIVWVGTQGVRDGSGIGVVELKEGKKWTLQDEDAPRGHEYFPTIEPSGRYLLFSSAPTGEHSHESANYELFVKDLKLGKVVQLSANGATNRWPKLLK